MVLGQAHRDSGEHQKEVSQFCETYQGNNGTSAKFNISIELHKLIRGEDTGETVSFPPVTSSLDLLVLSLAREFERCFD